MISRCNKDIIFERYREWSCEICKKGAEYASRSMGVVLS